MGELLEPRRSRLQWAMIVPLHSSMGDNERPHLKKKKEGREGGKEKEREREKKKEREKRLHRSWPDSLPFHTTRGSWEPLRGQRVSDRR